MSWSKRRGKVCSASEICGGAMPCRYRLEGKLAPVALTNSSAEKCSTSFSTDIAVLPSLTKGEPARPIRLSDPTCPFHASLLSLALPAPCHPRKMRKNRSGGARSGSRILRHRIKIDANRSNPTGSPGSITYPAACSGAAVQTKPVATVRPESIRSRGSLDSLTSEGG
jgi:hypothetical protein